MAAVLEFGVLGPLEARADGHAIRIGGPRTRALLAALLLNANEAVATDRLIEALWGEHPPRNGANAVQIQVSRLRRALGEAGTDATSILTTGPAGYQLGLAPEQLDLSRFRSLAQRGRTALEAHDYAEARSLLTEALALWRGPPLADLAYESFVQADIAALEELRLATLEDRVDAEIALGCDASLIAELRSLVAAHPEREGVRGQLMLALYRSGRQTEALDEYQRLRWHLAEELGLEPGPALQRLQRQILTHDPELAASATTPSRVNVAGLPPAPPTALIGRKADIEAVAALVRTPGTRLVTLMGPGGVGKTRLSLELARRLEPDFEDGARFVELAAVRRPEDAPSAVVQALGIVAVPGETAEQAATRFLSAKNLLLVLDTLEHLLPAAGFVARLLADCSALTILATSREPLALRAERRFLVRPLLMPDAGALGGLDVLGRVDAIALFCARAEAHDREFRLDATNAAAVVEICRRVDGLPLAIELAASRSSLLSADEIAERLKDAFGALGGGARDVPPRHHTLRETIDWSHNLLNDAEKACFARMAVFGGGASVEAAETITGADVETLNRLVSKSLLVRRPDMPRRARLEMLETIGAYAVECFAADPDREAVRERHCRYYLALAQRHATEQALWGVKRRQHLAALEDETANYESALDWAVATRKAELALLIVRSLSAYWRARTLATQAVRWIEQTLSLPGADAYPALCVSALLTKLACLWPLGRAAERPAVLNEARALANEVGDPALIARVCYWRSRLETLDGRLDMGSSLADDALRWASRAGDEWEIAMAFHAKAIAAPTLTDLRPQVDQASLRLAAVGNTWQLADLLGSAAYTALCQCNDQEANTFLNRVEPVIAALADPSLRMMARGNTGLAALFTGELAVARQAFREHLTICRDLAVHPAAQEGLLGLGAVAAAGNNLRRAAVLLGAAAVHGYGQQQDVIEQRVEAAFIIDARLRYGPDAWDSAAREGSALSFEDAIAYALEEPRA